MLERVEVKMGDQLAAPFLLLVEFAQVAYGRIAPKAPSDLIS